MKRREEEPNKIDPRLDVPSEANREKHINFLDEEEKSANAGNEKHRDEFSEERRKQWEQGIAEGKKARENE
jgi:hypothetical protein